MKKSTVYIIGAWFLILAGILSLFKGNQNYISSIVGGLILFFMGIADIVEEKTK